MTWPEEDDFAQDSPAEAVPRARELRRVMKWGLGLLALGFLVGLVVVIARDSRSFRLNIRFKRDPDRTKIQRNGPVYVDGLQAGYIKDVRSVGDDRIVVETVIREPSVIEQKLRHGLLATIQDDGSLALDSSHVKEGAAPLQDGAEILGASAVNYLIIKAFTWENAVILAIVVAAVFVAWLVLRSIIHWAFILIPVLAALALAIMFCRVLSPTVGEWLSGVSSEFANRAAETGGEGGLARITRPYPGVMSFLLIFFVSYGALQTFVAAMVRRMKKAR